MSVVESIASGSSIAVDRHRLCARRRPDRGDRARVAAFVVSDADSRLAARRCTRRRTGSADVRRARRARPKPASSRSNGSRRCALLLLPMVVLVATMPTWAERRNGATIAAREAARDLVDNWPNGSPAAAVLVAQDVAADHGIDASDVDVRVASSGQARGDEVEVDVEVTMPAIGVGGDAGRFLALHRPGHAAHRRLPEPVMPRPKRNRTSGARSHCGCSGCVSRCCSSGV